MDDGSSARAMSASLPGSTASVVASTRTRITHRGRPTALLTATSLWSAWTTSTGATKATVDPSSGNHALRIALGRANLQSTWSGLRTLWQTLSPVNSILKDMKGSEQRLKMLMSSLEKTRGSMEKCPTMATLL